jgi:alpha-glucuronidase
MGTRSLTYVYSYDEPVVCMYRQYDGYPTGHGAELAEFLNVTKVYNGMDCLAASMIAYFKKEPYNFYLYPTNLDQSCGQEYEYHVYDDKVKIVETNSSGPALFEGSWNELAEYCSVERYNKEVA